MLMVQLEKAAGTLFDGVFFNGEAPPSARPRDKI